MKTTVLNFRVSEDLKDLIDSSAEQQDLSSSKLVRQILEDHFFQSEEKKDEITLAEEEEYDNINFFEEEDYFEEKENVIYSLRFLQLISWVYNQRSNIGMGLENYRYEEFKATILKLNNVDQIDKELKDEFNKILAEIIQKKGSVFYKFKFTKFFGFEAFNYRKLNEFIFNNLTIEV